MKVVDLGQGSSIPRDVSQEKAKMNALVKFHQDTFVKFSKLLSDAAARVKEAHIKRKTKANFGKYQYSPRLKLSRLYGYKLREDGKAERVQEEARVIQRVFNMFVEHKSAEEIKATLDKDDVRTRFRDRWTWSPN